MRISERRCCVCGCKADPSKTSAHILVVLWFCTGHGTEFHTSPQYSTAKAALSSTQALDLITDWCDRATEAIERELRRAA
jgi:hypothetical protein